MSDNETYNEAPGTPGDHMNESNPDSFNGYANRETWAFNLHWQNDQGLYNETLDVAREWARDYPLIAEADQTGSHLGEAVVNYWRDFIDTYSEEVGAGLLGDLLMFDREVGSWWRINYAEVGEAVRDSLEVEGE